MKPGSLAITDYFIFEEGGRLFNTSQTSLDMTDYFLTAMEAIGSSNNVINKDLVAFNKSISTTSKSSLFIMTRPIGKIKRQVAESGFFQRCLFVPREVDFEIVNNMRIESMINDLDYMGGIVNEKTKEYYDDLVKEFIEVVNFSYNNDIIIEHSKINDIKIFLKTKLQWFYEDMKGSVSGEEFKIIISTLQNRYKDNIYKLAFHSACMRYSKVVDLEDFQYAFNLIQELYLEQKNWLFETIEITPQERKEKVDFVKMVYANLKLDKMGLKTLSSISTDIAQTTGLEYNVVAKKLIKLSKEPNTQFYVEGDETNLETAKLKLI
jgi:hypothetical protein